MKEITFFNIVNEYNHIFLYGAGMVGQLVLERLLALGISKSSLDFVVSDPKENQKFLGHSVYGVDRIKDCSTSHITIVATLKRNHSQIIDNLCRNGIREYLVIDEELHDKMDKNYISDFLSRNDDSRFGEKDVLFMSSDNNYSSGAFLCMVDLCKEMKINGIRPLVVLPRHGNAEMLLRDNDIDFTYVYSRSWLVPNDEKTIKLYENEEAFIRIKELVEKHNIKAIHNNSNHTYIGALVAKEMGLPYVWHIRENIYEQGFDFYDQKFADALINDAHCIISVSQYVGSCYENLNQKKMRFISDGVDSERYFCENRLFEEEITRILMPGIMVPLKGQNQLIEAANILRKDGYSFEVTFVGSGEADYIQKLYDQTHEYGLEKYIKFYDRVENIEELYRKNDIVVVCSRSEAFGRVTVEAMMSGCIVVGADCGATPELIEDGAHGFLYELNNEKDLAEVLEKTIDNKGLSREIAKKGQKHALNTFARDITSKHIIELYQTEFGL